MWGSANSAKAVERESVIAEGSRKLFSEKLALLQNWLVLLYAASLPVSLTASWIILCVGLSLWVLQLLAHSIESRSAVTNIEKPPLLLPLSLFAAALFLSGLPNGGVLEALDSVVSLRAVLVYFWAFQVFSSNRGLVFWCVQILLIVGAAAGVFGTIEQLFNFHPFGYRYLQGTGFLGSPMAYAGQMQILSALALAIFLDRGYWQFRFGLSRKPVFALITFANVLGVLFASERSAWLGAIAGAVALTAVLSWRTLIKTCLALAVVSALCWATVPVVHTRIAQLENWQQDVSVKARLVIWQESVRIWRSSPIFGVGVRHFPRFTIPEATMLGHSRQLNHAHNNYLHILSTTGLLGLLTYLWLWAAVLLTAWRIYRRTRGMAGAQDENALMLGILGSTIALLVSGLFEYNFGTAQVRLAQWFVLAMLPAVVSYSKSSKVPKESQS